MHVFGLQARAIELGDAIEQNCEQLPERSECGVVNHLSVGVSGGCVTTTTSTAAAQQQQQRRQQRQHTRQSQGVRSDPSGRAAERQSGRAAEEGGGEWVDAPGF